MGKLRLIVKEPQAILRNEAKEVHIKDITGSKIKALVLDMKKTLASTSDGVGLAAPQVGESLRIFIVSEEAEEIDKVSRESEKRYFRTEDEDKKRKPYEERKWK